MATLEVSISTDLNADTLLRDYQRPVSAKYPDVQAIASLLEAVISGNQPGTPPTVSVVNQGNAVQATGSFRLATVIATNTVTVNGVTLTAVASGAGNNQFNVGGSDTLTAVNLAGALNGSTTALVSGALTASASGVVVSLTSRYYGQAGNQTTIATGGATLIASSSRLTGGTSDPNKKIYTF